MKSKEAVANELKASMKEMGYDIDHYSTEEIIEALGILRDGIVEMNLAVAEANQALSYFGNILKELRDE